MAINDFYINDIYRFEIYRLSVSSRAFLKLSIIIVITLVGLQKGLSYLSLLVARYANFFIWLLCRCLREQVFQRLSYSEKLAYTTYNRLLIKKLHISSV